MDEQAPQVTPELARAQLEEASSARIGRGRDRWIHGSATIGFGLLLGAYLQFLGDVEDEALLFMLVGAALLVAGAITLWRRLAHSEPLHARRAVNIAWWATFGIIVVMPFLPPPPFDEFGQDLAGAGLIAAPIVVAGLWILFRR